MSPPRFQVLHYLGYDEDRGGIIAVVRALASTGAFDCTLGMNRGFQPVRATELRAECFSRLAGERLGIATLARARFVAREVGAWLDASPDRIFHGHSRAGLAVALWLDRAGERRVVASVHCYGRQRWFYRWAARRLGTRLFWLSPAMKQYYGIGGTDWTQCVPGCVPGMPVVRERAAGEVFTIVGIGALVPWKQWELVLDALTRLPDPIRQRLRFVHAGGVGGSNAARSYAAVLQRLSQCPSLARCVEWRGEVGNPQALLQEADALIVASHNEPFSVAMLEALFAGVPVIAADTGGARDVITGETNGWLFRGGDPDDLARVLASVTHPEKPPARAIDALALRRFSATHVAAQWREVYAALR